MKSASAVHVPSSARIDNAERFFRQPERYLARNYRIPLRARIVAELVGELSDARILDLGAATVPFQRSSSRPITV